MFTSTPPRNSRNAVCTNEENLLGSASAVASSVEASSIQRKRGRSDIMSTAMVSPFVMDQRYYYHANNNSTSSSPMTNDADTTRLEPLIESMDNTDTNQQQQEQQSMPLSQVSTTSSTTNNSASSSADPTSSSFHNNGTKLIYTTELQPPMKKVKVNNCSDVGDHYNNDVIPPLEEHKDDFETEEMACQRPCNKGSAAAAATTTKKKSLSKLIGITGSSSNIVDVPSATMSKMKDVASSPKNSQSSCCCHVCGGTGGDAVVDDVMMTQCSEDIGSGSNKSGGSNCASRSIASYFQVTKKHSSMKPDPTSPSLPPSSSSQPHKVLKYTNTPHQQSLLPPCRYCDRPTCHNNPSCIKQCEECQHNFCSFCCKVNYTGIYEKTVCFECDELIMLSHCCDRMELG